MSDVSDVLDVYNATKTFVIAKKISCFKSKLCQNPCSNTQYSMFQVVRNCPQLWGCPWFHFHPELLFRTLDISNLYATLVQTFGNFFGTNFYLICGFFLFSQLPQGSFFPCHLAWVTKAQTCQAFHWLLKLRAQNPESFGTQNKLMPIRTFNN